MRNLYEPIKGRLLQAFCIDHQVKPAARPRMSWKFKRLYVPDTTTKLARMIANETTCKPINTPVIVDCHVHIARPKKPKSFWPISNRVGDIDNLTKTVFDALQKSGTIANDNLAIAGTTTKAYGETSYVWIFIYEAESRPNIRDYEVSIFAPRVSTKSNNSDHGGSELSSKGRSNFANRIRKD